MIKRLSVVFAMLLGFTGLAWGAFEVRTLADLQKVGSGVGGWTPSAAYVLMNDIDATATETWNGGAGFAPIGNRDAGFSGIFDGQGHVIWGLTVNRPDEYFIGLFGYVTHNGTIRNLGLVGGRVRGDWVVGGLFGLCEGVTIERCFSFLRVEGGACTGGLIGRFYSGQVAQCYASGSVSGADRVGGLVGWLNYGILSQCYSAGAVTGSEFGSAGGLVGEVNGSPDGWGCYWDVETSGQEGSPAGVGLSQAQMKQSASYEGWDFESVWQVEEDAGYPYFRGTGTPYLLALTVQGPGRVTAVPPLATYPTGTVVRLTAAATAGQSEFVGWEVDGAVSTASVVRVTVDGPRSVIARFRSARGIGTVTDLQKIGRDSAFTLDGRYWLTQDLDAKAAAAWNGGKGFLPIGDADAPFTGVFDGRGKVIKNLTINRLTLVDEDSLAIGLFGAVSGGTLQNIGLTGVRISANVWDEGAGGLVGSLEGGTVRQCFVTGALEGEGSVGGLVGSSGVSLIEKCYAAVGILAVQSVGGLVGSVDGGTVRQCFTTGIVAGDDGVGGLIGEQYEAEVAQCYSAASAVRVGDEGAVGGLIGNGDPGVVTGSYWDRESGGVATSAGGEARTAAQMKQQATFIGWDFGSVWGLTAGSSYPYLRWSPPPFRLSSAYLGEGAITASPAGEALAAGTVVTLTATPAAGYVFTGWYGVDGATNTLKTTVVMNRPRVAAALFRRAIRSITELQKIGNDPGYPLDEYYVLTTNIDASVTATWNGGAGFKPIGTDEESFWGTLDGRGFAIRNLTINRPDEGSVGLFRTLEGWATDLAIESCAITGGDSVGALAGGSWAVVRRCSVRGTVKGNASVGGVVGVNSGDLRGCSAVCDVSGTTDVGGLAGVNKGLVKGCFANGRVRGGASVGALLGSSSTDGFCGQEVGSARVLESFAAGAVSGAEQVGGLVGTCMETDISACFATGAVGGEKDVGGLAGYFADGSLSDAYACGRVEGEVSVGGLAGRADRVTSSNSFWDVASSGQAVSAVGEGRATAELKQAATFSGEGFSNLWDLVETVSYPYLKAFPPPFGLYVATQGLGRVTVTPLRSAYAPGAVVQFSAEGVAGQSEFVGWIGAGPNATAAVVSVTMDAPRSVVAVFRTARALGRVEDLQKIGRDPAFTLDGHYWLTQDIDASETAYWNGQAGFLSIGTEVAPFTGVFDGQGHVIRSLTSKGGAAGQGVGLFGWISGGTVRNVVLLGGMIEATGGSGYAGGVVGFGRNATLENCVACLRWVYGRVAGGVAGKLSGGTMSRCYALGSVMGSETAGGLAGGVDGSALTECFSVGTVEGWNSVGGLIGFSSEGFVESGCYWDAEQSGQYESAGGSGRTTEQMKHAVTFEGWNFADVWGISEGASHPYLQRYGNPFYLIAEAEGPGRVEVVPQQNAYAPGAAVELTAIATAGQGAFLMWSGPGLEDATSAVIQVTMDTHRCLTALFRSERAVASVADFQNIGRQPGFTADGHYWLTNDLDAAGSGAWNNGTGFTPIAEFMGLLDGRGHVIRNLTSKSAQTDDEEGGYGLIGVLRGGTVRNLGLVGVQIDGGEETYNVGGLVGSNEGGTLDRCYVTGVVVGGAEDVGALVGCNAGLLTRCHAFATVRGKWGVGGLVGSLDGGAVEECFASCQVSGLGSVGGLVGYGSGGRIARCYATGTVQGQRYVGGLVGELWASDIETCYAAATVAGRQDVGGLAGSWEADMGSVAGSYWDAERSQCGVSCGGTGLLASGMRHQASFDGWDFVEVWGIAENQTYPYLRWSPPPFRLDVALSGQGAVSKTPAAAAYAAGSVVSLTATPAAGCLFVGWTGLGPVANAPKVSVAMDGHRAVKAVFARAITAVAELQKIGNDPAYPLDGSYALKADIDAAATATWNGGKGFAPLGTAENPFTGTFDGRGFAVKGLTVKRPDEERVGLFAVVADGLVENLRLTSASVQGDMRVGGLAGVVSGEYASVRNCAVSGGVAGSDYTGGLVGYLSGLVEGCHTVCAVSGSVRAGGLVGCVQGGMVASCFANGTVTGLQQIGGLVGYLIPTPSMTDGVCGPGEEDWTYVTGGRVEASHSSGSVEGQFLVGGLVGYNDKGDVSACYSTAYVAGTDAVGGLVGVNASEGYEGRGQVFLCYAEGRVRLMASAGAFGHPYAGGLLGWNGGVVTECYAAGQVLAEPQDSDQWAIGGLVGAGEPERVNASYWDLECSQLETSAGGEGRFTEEMWWQSTFASWDFESVWGIDEGADYPYLLAFNSFGFGQPRVEVCESERSVAITVDGGLTDKASAITVTLVPGTAGLSDYTAPAAAALKLSWVAGEVGPKTVTIPLKPDALAEGDEVFYAVLGLPVGGALARPCACAVTILDDDSAETLARALDNAALTWTTGGAVKWSPLADEGAANGSAAFSAALATGKISFVQASGVSGAGTLGFRWRAAAAAASAPALKLYDGKTLLWSSPVSEDAGDTGWIDEEVAVAGTAAHTFRWDAKQGADPAGVAGLDRVAWTPDGQSPATVYLGAEGAQGGWVSGGGQYWVGARVPVEAAALPGWRFVQWRDGGTLAKRTLTLEGDVELNAVFVRVPYVVGLPHTPAFGTVTGGGYCLPGKTVKLTAAPASGYTLLRWEDGSQAAARTISTEQAEEGMGADGLMRCTASFGLTALLAPPTVANPGPQTAMVGVPFALPLEITSESEPIVQITGLPSGITYSADTRTFTGVPTAATPPDKAPSLVKVSVSNAGNLKTPATVSFTLTVEALPAWAVGAFNGTVTHPLWRADLDGTVDVVEPASLTITALGKVTGKLTLRGTNYTFAAAAYADRILWTWYDEEGTPQQREKFLVEALAVAGKNVMPLSLDVSWQGYPDDTGVLPQTLSVATQAERQTLQGELLPAEDLNLCLYRNVWADKGMAAVVTNFTGYYTVTLPGSEGYGSGYLALTVDKAWNVKTAGKLADGTAVSLSGPLTLDENGRVWALLLTAPAAYKGGSFYGKAEFVRAEDGAVCVRPLIDTSCLWESLNPAATWEYGVGFRRWLDLSGGWYNALINLRGYYENGLTVGGVAMPPPTFSSRRVTDYDLESGLEQPPKKTWTETNEVGCVEVSPNGVVLGVTPATGMGTGLAAPAADAPVKRTDGTYDYTMDANRDGTVNASALTFGLIRATGLFKGSFNVYYDYVSAEDRTTDPVKQTWAHTVKKASFEGALTPVRASGEVEGCGFFLWADTGMGFTGRMDASGEPTLAPYAFSRSYDVLLFRQ